jgi:hypothetical protein
MCVTAVTYFACGWAVSQSAMVARAPSTPFENEQERSGVAMCEPGNSFATVSR